MVALLIITRVSF